MDWNVNNVGSAFAEFSGVLAGFAFIAIFSLIGQVNDPRQKAFFERSRKLQYALPILFTELVFATVMWALVAGAEGDRRAAAMTAAAGVLLALATVQLILSVLLYADASLPSWAAPPHDRTTAGSPGWIAYRSLLRTGVWMFRVSVFGAACLISYVYDAANEVVLDREQRIGLTLSRAALIAGLPMAFRGLEILFYLMVEHDDDGNVPTRAYEWCRNRKEILPIFTMATVAALLVAFFRVSALSIDKEDELIQLFDTWRVPILLVLPTLVLALMELYIGSQLVRHLHNVAITLVFRRPDNPSDLSEADDETTTGAGRADANEVENGASGAAVATDLPAPKTASASSDPLQQDPSPEVSRHRTEESTEVVDIRDGSPPDAKPEPADQEKRHP